MPLQWEYGLHLVTKNEDGSWTCTCGAWQRFKPKRCTHINRTIIDEANKRIALAKQPPKQSATKPEPKIELGVKRKITLED